MYIKSAECAILRVLTLTGVANHVLILTVRICKGARITSNPNIIYNYICGITPPQYVCSGIARGRLAFN